LLSAPLLRNRGIFRVFSPALDLEKTACLTIKTARTRNGSPGRLLSQDFRFFRLLTVRRGEMQTVGKYHFEQLVAECFCAAVIEKQLRNDGLSVPLCRDDIVGGLFCHRRLLSPGAKKGFPVSGKSLSAVGYSVLLCWGCGGCLRLFPRPVFPRFHAVILPLL